LREPFRDAAWSDVPLGARGKRQPSLGQARSLSVEKCTVGELAIRQILAGEDFSLTWITRRRKPEGVLTFSAYASTKSSYKAFDESAVQPVEKMRKIVGRGIPDKPPLLT
jgi:hypothetical protein